MKRMNTTTLQSVFAITNNHTPELLSAKLYVSKELARKQLKKMLDERKDNLGVRHVKETEDGFSLVLGWEGIEVRYRIVELMVEQ